jgi:2-C-methyl-D-erythritol 2,4-cyclodiphosphate synthase
MQIRIGQGIDIHRFKAGRKLILGGIEIPHTSGLDGHSDADVLLHALIDAILGALGLGDIGTHFPDSDDKWKGADSRKMLEIVVSKMKTAGYSVSNFDSTILTEEPKLMPHIPAIRESIAGFLGVDASSCSVKAGTSERLGYIGRQEGMLAQCVVLIQKD